MKKIVVGILIGGLLFSNTSVFANGNILVANWIKFFFNGDEKKLPSGYSVLLHDGHTYVPARFVAEELGAEVVWDEKNKTISIDHVKPVEDDVRPVEDDKEPVPNTEEPSTIYNNLPVSKTIDGVRVEVYDISHENSATRLFIRVKNTSNIPYQLDQESVYVRSNGTSYKHVNVTNQLYLKDKNWFKNINEDETVEGSVLIPSLPQEEGEREGTLNLIVRKNDVNPKDLHYQFDIKW